MKKSVFNLKINRVSYSRFNKPSCGLECMILPDVTENDPCTGTRYLYGRILEVNENKVQIIVTKSSWKDFKLGDEIWFDRLHIWPESEKHFYRQLRLDL